MPSMVDLARILILAIDRRPRSERLIAAPRPVVSSATAEDQKQYEYYQDSFHIITPLKIWNNLQNTLSRKFYARRLSNVADSSVSLYVNHLRQDVSRRSSRT